MDKTKYGPYGQTLSALAQWKIKLWQISSYFYCRKEMFWGVQTTLKAGNSRFISALHMSKGKCGKRSSRSHSLKIQVYPCDIPHVAVDNWPNWFSHFCTHQLGIDSLHKHITKCKLYIMMWLWNSPYIKSKNCQILSELGTGNSKYFVELFSVLISLKATAALKEFVYVRLWCLKICVPVVTTGYTNY